MNKLTIVVIFISSLLLTGCAIDPVVVTYSQRVNFEMFDPDPAAQPHQTYGGGVTMVYIKSIKNPVKTGKTYQFSPDKLYFGDINQGGWNVSWQHHVIGVPWRAGNKAVASGTTATNLGCVAIPILDQAKNYAYFLYHKKDQVPVLLVREGEAQANVFNAGVAYKQTLQQHCQP